MMEQITQNDQRTQKDRRKNPAAPRSICLIGGRRKHLRRAEDAKRGYYVDLYSKRSVFIISTILIMSIIDGYLTLSLVEQGAMEANPIMRFYLQLNTPLFLSVKYAVSYMSVFLLLIHKNFYILKTSISVKQLILGILGIYAGLIVWEMVLFV
jgi:hypothetical protein